jgi:hypothetical protein
MKIFYKKTIDDKILITKIDFPLSISELKELMVEKFGIIKGSEIVRLYHYEKSIQGLTSYMHKYGSDIVHSEVIYNGISYYHIYEGKLLEKELFFAIINVLKNSKKRLKMIVNEMECSAEYSIKI